MKNKFLNILFLIALLAATSSLMLNKEEKNQNFLEPKEPRLSLAQMLAENKFSETLKREEEDEEEEEEREERRYKNPRPMLNSGYLFYGYNIYYGNPHSTTGSIDPGFTKPIFQTSYEGKELTGDLRFQVADGSVIGKNVGCDVSLSSKEISDASSYQTSLEAEISGGASFGIGAFSASASFKAVLTGSKSKDDMFVESKADCRVFSGELNFYEPPKLHHTFVRAIDYIDDLDFEQAKDDYFHFIQYFGTHFIRSVDMGARYGYLEKTTKTAYTSGNTFSAKVSVSGSYGAGNASASVGASSDRQSSGSNMSKDVKVFSIGVPPPADGNALAWAEKTLSEPMPIKYEIRSLIDIFTNRFFDLSSLNSTEHNINKDKFKGNLEKAYKAYCKEYLKPMKKVLFCTEDEFKKVIENGGEAPAFKPQDGATLIIKNSFTQKCLTYKGNRQRVNFENCDNKNVNQIFRLEWVNQKQAFKIFTTGPNSNGQMDYGAGMNRLQFWDFEADFNNDNRLFRFSQDGTNGTWRMRVMRNLNACFQISEPEFLLSDCNYKSDLHLIG